MVQEVFKFLIQFKRFVQDGVVILFVVVHTPMSELGHLVVIMIFLLRTLVDDFFLPGKQQLENIQLQCTELS